MRDLVTAKDDGWYALRSATFRRDRGCVAVQRDIVGAVVADTLCRDRYGVIAWDDLSKMEFMHVLPRPMMSSDKRGRGRPDDIAHGVTGCRGHHQGGWGTRRESIAAMRDYLRRLYPEVWDATA